MFPGNEIEESSYISPRVNIGTGNYIGHNTVLLGNIDIGDNNYISDSVVIGRLPQHYTQKYEFKSPSTTNQNQKIIIGNENVIREFVSINAPIKNSTKIGHNNYIMIGSHIAHDCLIENHVTLSSNTILGGYVKILNHAILGMNSTIHQKTIIGQYSMIALGSNINKNIPPFALVHGNPSKFVSLNKVGLERNNFNKNDIKNINYFYKNHKSELSKNELDIIKKTAIPIHLKSIFIDFMGHSKNSSRYTLNMNFHKF